MAGTSPRFFPRGGKFGIQGGAKLQLSMQIYMFVYNFVFGDDVLSNFDFGDNVLSNFVLGEFVLCKYVFGDDVMCKYVLVDNVLGNNDFATLFLRQCFCPLCYPRICFHWTPCNTVNATQHG